MTLFFFYSAVFRFFFHLSRALPLSAHARHVHEVEGENSHSNWLLNPSSPAPERRHWLTRVKASPYRREMSSQSVLFLRPVEVRSRN